MTDTSTSETSRAGCPSAMSPSHLAGDAASTPARDARTEGLHRRFAASRDPVVRDALIERYLPLARFTAARYARRDEPIDDLVQVACIGLVKAVDRYDPERQVAFSSFAMPTMRGEILRHFRDRTWAVRPPRDLQESVLRVDRAVDDLTRARGLAPTVDEIARHLGLDEEAVLEAREAARARTSISTSVPLGDDDDGSRDLERQLGRPDDGFASAEHRATIDHLSRVLTPREREILRLRFDEDLTQQEIGDAIGLSQMQVSRILRASIEQLHRDAHA